MTRVALSYPYPDELLYSVISRYLSSVGPTSRTELMKALTGRQGKPVIDLPKYLNRVSEVTFESWGLTGLEIANRFTLAPLYTWPLSLADANECLDKLLGSEPATAHKDLKVTGEYVTRPAHLRICPVCLKEDIRKYDGITYWHRVHQIPGLLICPDHNVPLVNTTATYDNRSIRTWEDANNVSLLEGPLATENFTTTQMAQAYAISVLLHTMLQGLLPKPESSFKDYYTLRAFDAGIINSTLRVDRRAIISSFLNFYQQSFLHALGLPEVTERRHCWLTQVLFNLKYKITPLHHSVLLRFFDALDGLPSRPENFSHGPYRCLNVECRKSPLPTAIAESFHRTSTGLRITAKCSCGFIIEFSDSKDAVPIEPTIIAFSPKWLEDVNRLNNAGSSALQISKIMSTTAQIIRRVIGGNADFLGLSFDERRIEALEEKWREVTTESSVLEAKRNYPELYRLLFAYDRKWLYKYNRASNRRVAPPVRAPRAFTPERDLDWSKRATLAVEKELKTRSTNYPYTRGILAMSAGLNSQVISENAERLPLTMLALERGVRILNQKN
ncbi:TnsD family Tn7-like transposition protein [Cupriavidus basilensis]|uniref:Transposon Tn7 transposition protein tnsD n=1 Tax=Cupriavidus basilensis TaxID=68895 RepID=A0A0C4YGK4_9BURK|nr:TnsD family Tn7-like transposition protein [Cupriavidus basilensis]AJG24992.1 Transposon Tn7 transposition protein tnsD [Cupriavidus basilensis]